jgi:hypothetical protein
VLVGHYGAGLMNALFMPRGSVLVMLLNYGMPPQFNMEYRNTATVAGLLFLEWRLQSLGSVRFRSEKEKAAGSGAAKRIAAGRGFTNVVFRAADREEVLLYGGGESGGGDGGGGEGGAGGAEYAVEEPGTGVWNALKMASMTVDVAAVQALTEQALGMGVNQGLA